MSKDRAPQQFAVFWGFCVRLSLVSVATINTTDRVDVITPVGFPSPAQRQAVWMGNPASCGVENAVDHSQLI